MRPERLFLRGFGAFRQETVVDFSGVELFALTGPLGSGKTTILDGICFALYGSVPRHGKGSLAPVVSQGLMEATVALSFSIGDHSYQVARTIRKEQKGKGANTSEASLEMIGRAGGVEVLAIGGQVTVRTAELLGLDFEQFTTCVLLPQGEFARFLHDKPADRQDLLSALLDLGIYDTVGQLALTRQRTAEAYLALLEQRLAEIGAVTPEDLAAARDQESKLTSLLRWVEETLPELVALESEARDLTAEVDRHDSQLRQLRALRVPGGIEVVGAEVAAQRTEEVATQEALDAARTRAEELAGKRAAGPSRGQINAWIAVRNALAEARKDLGPAAAAASAAAAAWKEAETLVAGARSGVSIAADSDRAAHLRRGLKLGDPCPICGQPITELLDDQDPGTSRKAEAALSKAEKAERDLRKAKEEADNTVRRLGDRITDNSQQLDGVPEMDDLLATLGTVESIEKELADSGLHIADLKRDLQAVQQRRKATADREEAIRTGLANSWHQLAQAGFEPPQIDQTDPFRSWRDLLDWRTETEPRVLNAADKARALVEDANRRRQLVMDGIATRLEETGIETGLASARDAVVDALSLARARRERVESALTELAVTVTERESSARRQKVARQLSLELRADRFKKWLFDEVFSALVVGANGRLFELTRGQYELVIEGREFEVIDNLSAGNRRSVKTLSGGETFLVSLALALALAEQVAESSVAGTRLDSFFLDEGFGTLDAESLEVVAGVIADLGASGKTVGIVTHVAELAEQMPVRYEVRKSADGAMVTEVRQ